MLNGNKGKAFENNAVPNKSLQRSATTYFHHARLASYLVASALAEFTRYAASCVEKIMGAWGINTFENDDALDWLGEFCDEPSEDLLFEDFAVVNDVGDEYLEAPESSAALAAAEIVAALRGKPSASLSDEAKECVRNFKLKPNDELISAAQKAVARVQTDSELKELWDESDDAPKWQATVQDLSERLKP